MITIKVEHFYPSLFFILLTSILLWLSYKVVEKFKCKNVKLLKKTRKINQIHIFVLMLAFRWGTTLSKHFADQLSTPMCTRNLRTAFKVKLLPEEKAWGQREWCHFSYFLPLIFCCCGDLDKDGPGGMELFLFTSINKLK